jgi:cell wall assembly regulator SMI1
VSCDDPAVIEPPRTYIDPPIAPVAASWQRIDAWLARHAPASHAALHPPASEDDLTRTETALGFPLPPDLRASLLHHNGERWPGALPGGPLYSTAQIVQSQALRMDIWEPDDPDTAGWWGARWVPFAGGDGDDHFIDAGPGLWHQHIGYAGHTESGCYTGWPTLGTFLQGVAEALEHMEDPNYVGTVSRPMLNDDGEVYW